ncbi:MAG: hypothetical protein KGI73_01130 [Patescibacteria group bacterium]|nr:hypothetical protein [Patescibacteria group bacterium]
MARKTPEFGLEGLREPVVQQKFRKDGVWYHVTLEYRDYDKRQRLQTITLMFQRPKSGTDELALQPLEYRGIDGKPGFFLEADVELEKLKTRALEAIGVFEIKKGKKNFP